MNKVIRTNQPMRLQGTKNTRELGGYPTESGNSTVNGVFLRSDKPVFTNRDKEILYNYGVRLIIDLRSDYETKRKPCTMKDYNDVEYINCQLLDAVMATKGERKVMSSLIATYRDLLENSKATFLEIFKKILIRKDQCILFCCTAGKDRTGVLAMLLLKLAGVPDEILVADYAATYFHVKEDMKMNMIMIKLMRVNIPLEVLYSEPENMIATLEYLKENYGTVESYLNSVGLSDKEIALLRNRLLGK